MLDTIRPQPSPPSPAETQLDAEIHALCLRWADWRKTRRLYGPSPALKSVLGTLYRPRGSAPIGEPPDAIVSAQLSALHVAYTCQPDDIDKRAFDLYYVHRIKPVKSAAHALGVSRVHYYRLLRDFRLRVYRAAQDLLQTA